MNFTTDKDLYTDTPALVGWTGNKQLYAIKTLTDPDKEGPNESALSHNLIGHKHFAQPLSKVLGVSFEPLSSAVVYIDITAHY